MMYDIEEGWENGIQQQKFPLNLLSQLPEFNITYYVYIYIYIYIYIMYNVYIYTYILYIYD